MKPAPSAAPPEGLRTSHVLIGLLVLAILMTAIAVYFRRKAGPAYARERLAALGVDLAQLDARARQRADFEAALTDDLERAARSGAPWTGVPAVLSSATAGDAPYDVGPDCADAERTPAGDPWAARLRARSTGQWVRVDLAPAFDPAHVHQIRHAFALLDELRAKQVEWPLAIAALGLARADRGAAAPPYTLYQRRPWSVEARTQAGESIFRSIVAPEERALRMAELCRVRALLDDASADADLPWADVVPRLEAAIQALYGAEAGWIYRYRVSVSRPSMVQAIRPGDAENVLLSPGRALARELRSAPGESR